QGVARIAHVDGALAAADVDRHRDAGRSGRDVEDVATTPAVDAQATHAGRLIGDREGGQPGNGGAVDRHGPGALEGIQGIAHGDHVLADVRVDLHRRACGGACHGDDVGEVARGD